MIVEADPGTQIEKERTKKTIEEALETLERKIDLEEKGCYRVAKTEEENKILADARDKANKYMQSEITYNWNGSEVVVDGDLIHEWVIIDGNTVRLDEEKIGEFVTEQAKNMILMEKQDIPYDGWKRNRVEKRSIWVENGQGYGEKGTNWESAKRGSRGAGTNI